MDGAYWILLLFILAAVVFFYWRRKKARPENKLWEKCIRTLNMPPDSAAETMGRLRENLERKFPGRSEQWYLEKILYDLEKDRR